MLKSILRPSCHCCHATSDVSMKMRTIPKPDTEHHHMSTLAMEHCALEAGCMAGLEQKHRTYKYLFQRQCRLFDKWSACRVCTGLWLQVQRGEQFFWLTCRGHRIPARTMNTR